ncbi:MAG TPA: M35 family metallo-endopeptidase [Gemmatimonadaceae bacterium]|nr:M35 family metallo-endopeptidase [Gemmatimonadaceae bacterium]
MFKVRGEGLTATQLGELTSVCTRVAALAKAAHDGAGNRAKWFGTLADSPFVMEGLRIMDEYLNTKCVGITFVRKMTGQIVDQVSAEASDYGQVLPNVFTTTVNFRETPRHVSSGLRIYAMNEIIAAIDNDDQLEQANYVYHEVSHKVLDTVDFRYGQSSCQRLARRHPRSAVRNADNWGYLIGEMA